MSRQTLISVATGILLATVFNSASFAAEPMMDDPILIAFPGTTGLTTAPDNNAAQDQAQPKEQQIGRRAKKKRIK